MLVANFCLKIFLANWQFQNNRKVYKEHILHDAIIVGGFMSTNNCPPFYREMSHFLLKGGGGGASERNQPFRVGH